VRPHGLAPLFARAAVAPCTLALRTLALRTLALCTLVSSSAWAAPNWYLEMPAGAPSEASARRTLALELEGIAVPPDALRIGDASDDVQLHIAVTVESRHPETGAEEWLLVRVWDRGELAGSRRVSAVGHPTTIGRRVALAAAELVRQLAALRTRNRRLAVRREQDSEIERQIERQQAVRRRVALESDLHFVWAPEGAWLVGPSVGLEFNRQLPLRFRTGLSLLAGEIYKAPIAAAETPLTSWLDAHAGVYWTPEFGTNWSGEVGGLLALALVDVGGGASVDDIANQSATWTARLGAELAISRAIGPGARVRFGFGVGALLRPIPITLGDAETRLGGAYLGAQVALLVRQP
jgi:hypothetical protein